MTFKKYSLKNPHTLFYTIMIPVFLGSFTFQGIIEGNWGIVVVSLLSIVILLSLLSFGFITNIQISENGIAEDSPLWGNKIIDWADVQSVDVIFKMRYEIRYLRTSEIKFPVSLFKKTIQIIGKERFKGIDNVIEIDYRSDVFVEINNQWKEVKSAKSESGMH
ncbi:MAG: hypothetical protein LCH54_06705 [Bacteroidetes bacterium]|nr:hypothetical protein [Bacteroidota bacterium]